MCAAHAQFNFQAIAKGDGGGRGGGGASTPDILPHLAPTDRSLARPYAASPFQQLVDCELQRGRAPDHKVWDCNSQPGGPHCIHKANLVTLPSLRVPNRHLWTQFPPRRGVPARSRHFLVRGWTAAAGATNIPVVGEHTTHSVVPRSY
jgi:hypothetical protein